MTIATQTDVEASLQRRLSTTEAGFIADLLARADGLIARELPGVTFSGTARSTADIPGADTFEVWLPARPVLNVVSVTLDGTVLGYGTDYDWSEFGDLDRTSGNKIWARTSDISVVWDHGLVTPPPDVVTVAADMVAVGIANPTGIRQESIGQYSYTLAEAAARMRVTDDQRRILDHYRFPVPI
jgi:hypothetical protein